MEIVQHNSISLKQIFQENWEHFLSIYSSVVESYMAYNVWKIMNCREPEGLGYVTYACPFHSEEVCHVPRTCKSRFCSVCAKVQVDKWVAGMNDLFPNCSYFHVTFTVPSQFRTLLFEKRSLLNAVFSSCTETLLSFCKEQGFLPAITAVLHTFGSDLKRHVHVHCILSAGGLKLTGKQERYTRFKNRKKKNPKAKMNTVSVVTETPEWISWNKFPYKMLQKRYQALLIKHLKKQIQYNIESDDPDPDLKVFSEPLVMKAFFDDLISEYQNGFYVHISTERQELEQTVKYIGRYARRPPISEVRIKENKDEWITFEYKDYRNNANPVLYTLKTVEFIRKLIRHIPPHYFNVIRHYGIIASRVKSQFKQMTFSLLGKLSSVKKAKNWRERQSHFHGSDPMLCKICNTLMIFVFAYYPNSLSSIKKHMDEKYS
jgi:hypothetical protein